MIITKNFETNDFSMRSVEMCYWVHAIVMCLNLYLFHDPSSYRFWSFLSTNSPKQAKLLLFLTMSLGFVFFGNWFTYYLLSLSVYCLSSSYSAMICNWFMLHTFHLLTITITVLIIWLTEFVCFKNPLSVLIIYTNY